MLLSIVVSVNINPYITISALDSGDPNIRNHKIIFFTTQKQKSDLLEEESGGEAIIGGQGRGTTRDPCDWI